MIVTVHEGPIKVFTSNMLPEKLLRRVAALPQESEDELPFSLSEWDAWFSDTDSSER